MEGFVAATKLAVKTNILDEVLALFIISTLHTYLNTTSTENKCKLSWGN